MSKSDTTEISDTSAPAAPAESTAAPAEQAAAPTETPAAPAGPPKSQLRRRVDARIAELEAALQRFGDDPAKQKQARAIQMALKGAHDSMNLGAERVGAMEAALMTRWLESTQYLAGPTS